MEVKSEWATILLAIFNAGQIVYFAWKKLKPEVKKLEIEGDSELVEAANMNLEGAKTSAQMLLDRINELKQELKEEREDRKREFEKERKARNDDAEYFRRRIKELDREAKDYRIWAAKLAKQVIEAGKIPAAFVPSLNDSEPSILAVDDKERK
jgi:polyhydroxyalkanoate synthesis regulator phasin